ncbi:DNA polymerase I [Helicobacter enhydrae]|uniref:DNA polymerase I n=1 Tax=Helicobacter enhydrae TaxID=222136 RepID=A0A1B1U629_9HELI|nr:DNA polymerase I [Helicobacter enhydrae]ANV98181.1 DNA polymerase I [Helicobacter enhydrae]
MRTLSIIDTFGFFFRSYYALPPLKNSEGFPTGLLLGFAKLIQRIHKEGSTDYLVFALEGGGTNYRKLIDPNYKANRPPAPQELLMQLPIAIEWIEKMGFQTIAFEGYEADDAIASFANWGAKNAHNVKIISNDKDLYQLINERVFLYDPIKKQEIREIECLQKWGVNPQDFVDFQSLIGDQSDNVPGVKGIGSKTAQKLINAFHNLDTIFENLAEVEKLTSKRIVNLLEVGQENAYHSKKLVTLTTDLIDDFHLVPFPSHNPLECIADELDKYDFERLSLSVKKQNPFGAKKKLSRLIKQENIPQQFSFQSHLLTKLDAILELLENHPIDSVIAYDCETDSLNTQEAKMVGFSFSLDGKNGYYVPIAHNYLGVGEQLSHEDAYMAIQKIFQYPLIGHNLKFDILITQHNFNLIPQNHISDSMILAWLYDSSSHIGLDKQMFKWFHHKMISFESIVQKNENFACVDIAQASKYASEDAVATYRLFFRLQEEIKNQGSEHLLKLAQELEFPLIFVLAGMESNGIKIDIPFFQELQDEIGGSIAKYSAQVYEYAKEDFNLNSPQQLAHILFEKLNLQGGKRVKGGFSTEEKVLEKLIDAHPIIAPILKYREANKLKNTYIDPLLKLANPKHKVFTSFLQTGTATGRLSSKSPNLQNIPVRTEFGRQIRQGFIAQEGNTLLSVDYSQIELRLLAHFSEDPKLIQAFHDKQDIHTQTALKIFGECDVQKRSIAKTINFGLLYGMGAKKLAESLKITQKEAKEYIQNYFSAFPTIKSFLKIQEDNIASLGYAQTLLGHRRYFDFANATEFEKANFLREGINTIFQGSAADLIKLAMLKIKTYIANTPVKMLIQVHDELIFELPEQGAMQYAQEIASIMNGIYVLKVPLECGVNLGQNWAQLK